MRVDLSRLRYRVSVAMVALLLGLPGAGLAQDEVTLRRAQAHVDLGAEFFRDAKYEVAIEEFRQAAALVPLPEYSYYVARCMERLERNEAALELYERFAVSAGAPALREKAKAAAATLAKRLRGGISIRCDPEGARAQLQGGEERACPTQWEGLRPGPYRVTVWAERRSPGFFRTEVRAGAVSEVSAVLTLLPGRIVITSTQPGGFAWLDGRPIGRLPLAPVPVVPGAHTVTVVADNQEMWRQRLLVGAGEEVVAAAKMSTQAPQAAPPPAPSLAPAPQQPGTAIQPAPADAPFPPATSDEPRFDAEDERWIREVQGGG